MSLLWRLRRMAAVGPAGVRQVARIAWRLAQLILGSYLPAGVRFAGEPCFPHGMHGIFIAGAARLGADVVIFQHVTIGSNTLLDSKGFGAPTLGDRVFVGAGAKIIGAVTIGDDARIAAGAVVARDVPANATVLPSGEIRPSATPRDNRFFRYGRGGWEFFRAGGWVRSDEPLRLDQAGAKPAIS